MLGPALALIEVESIARGMVVADALVKKAPVELLLAGPVTPGKYLVLFCGGVGEVEESWKAGKEAADPLLLDALFLPQAHPALVPAIRASATAPLTGSAGIVETQTVASALLAADRALKSAEVRLVRSGFARGIGGKGYFVVCGRLEDVEAALAAAAASIQPALLLHVELIAAPHPELLGPVF